MNRYERTLHSVRTKARKAARDGKPLHPTPYKREDLDRSYRYAYTSEKTKIELESKEQRS